MKLKSKLKLYEEFVNVNRQVNDSNITKTDVTIDKVSVNKEDAIRTEVIKDVDTILNNLIELSDRIGEGVEIDTLFEELFETLNVTDLNEGIMDIIKSPIKYMKISKALKGYQKALVSQSINDLDFAKKKDASDVSTDEKGADPALKKKLEVLKQANLAKNKALKDQADAYSERMSELSKGDEGLGTVVSLGKAKSKIAASNVTMKAASGEEAKALKLKIQDLESRVADDEKSLKDYAKNAEGDNNDTEGDTEAQSNTQLAGSEDTDGKPKSKPTETPEPTGTPTPEPTGTPTPEPTGTPTPEPTGTPTPEPTGTPEPTAEPAAKDPKIQAIEDKIKEYQDGIDALKDKTDADSKNKVAMLSQAKKSEEGKLAKAKETQTESFKTATISEKFRILM